MADLDCTYDVGSPCPDCGKPMTYDAGEPMSRDHPGEPDSVGCEDCGIWHAPRCNATGGRQPPNEAASEAPSDR